MLEKQENRPNTTTQLQQSANASLSEKWAKNPERKKKEEDEKELKLARDTAVHQKLHGKPGWTNIAPQHMTTFSIPHQIEERDGGRRSKETFGTTFFGKHTSKHSTTSHEQASHHIADDVN